MATADPAPRIAAIRRTFQDEVTQRCVAFAQDLLTLVPELECVAVVPSYAPPQDRAPAGYVVGRQGQPGTPQEIVHVAAQLHLVLRQVMESSFTSLKSVDDRMARMAQEIRERTAELARLNQQIAEHPAASQSGAGDRNPANGPEPGRNS